MGLKVRHNGIITDLSGNEYDPSGLGTKRLKIRAGGSVKEFGLTTDPNALSYCGLNVKVAGSKYYIGRKSTSLETSTYTETNQSTRQGNATRSSSYEANTNSTGLEYAGTEYRTGYRYSYTYTGYTRATQYSFSYTGDNIVSNTIKNYYTQSWLVNWYNGSSWTRTHTERWWTRNRASTNGVTSGGWVTADGSWGPAVALTSNFTLSTTYVNNQRSTGATQSEKGSFNGNYTSAAWAYVSSTRSSRAYIITSYTSSWGSALYMQPTQVEVIEGGAPADYGTQGVALTTTLEAPAYCTQIGVNIFTYKRMQTLGTTSKIGNTTQTWYFGEVVNSRGGRYTYKTYSSETTSVYATNDGYLSNSSASFTAYESMSSSSYRYVGTNYNTTTSHYTVSSSRQSGYTYESQYTITNTKTSSSTLITHNFV